MCAMLKSTVEAVFENQKGENSFFKVELIIPEKAFSSQKFLSHLTYLIGMRKRNKQFFGYQYFVLKIVFA